MSDFTHHGSLTMRMCRCLTCGAFFAHESRDQARCPKCAAGEVTDLRRRIGALERSIRSLKGALTTSRRREAL